MAKTKIGFDIGNSSLKVAVARNGRVSLHEVRLPEHLVENDVIVMPNAFSDFLKKTSQKLNLPKAEGALLLPASQAICRLVTMPKMTEDQLMMNLPYEFSDFIQGEPDQYTCDYALCEEETEPVEGAAYYDEEETEAPEEQEHPEEITMMAAATSKKQVANYLRMFGAAKIPLKMLLPQEMALIELVAAYSQGKPDAPREFCFIDLGQLSTRVFVVTRDRVQAVRQVPIGCRDLDMIVADELNIDVFLADAYKRKDREKVLESPRCMDLYGRISVEILKVINFYQFTFRQNQLDRIYLIGGGANIQPLCQIIMEQVGLPAFPADALIPGVDKDNELSSSGIFAAAMALAKEE
jgi:type IV pilus assembly protein PilM